MKLIIAHELESDIKGKTWKEKNMEVKHSIRIGALVEIKYEGAENNGVRLFVVKHTRDCDGTPLYVLAPTLDAARENKRNPYINKMVGGYGEDSITLIQEPNND